MSQWHYKLGENEHGPVSFAELVELVRSGAITESVLVRRAASDTWARAWTIQMLFTTAARPATGAAPSGPPSEPRLGPGGPSAGDATRRPVSRGQGPLLPATGRGGEQSTLARYRWAFTAAVTLTAILWLYRWSYWRNLAFPRAPSPGEKATGFVFPLVGHCTAVESALLYFD